MKLTDLKDLRVIKKSLELDGLTIRAWGFEPVIGPNVDKLYRGKYAGTPEERVADLRWALQDPSIKAILCNRAAMEPSAQWN